MVIINLSDLEQITPKRGGKRKPDFSLHSSGYFRANKRFKESNQLSNKKAVIIKAAKKEGILIMAFNFLDTPEKDAFALAPSEKNGSFSFSGRSIFAHLNLEYKKIVSKKSIKLNPEIQEISGSRYFIVEIPIKEGEDVQK